MLKLLFNRITMYRLTLYYLIGLLLVATAISSSGLLPYNPLVIVLTTFECVGTCLLVNTVMSRIFRASTNVESTLITALILSLLITPRFPMSFVPILIASTCAMSSKYLLTIKQHHIFNPAAIGMVALFFLSSTPATWWVGAPILLPFVAIGGYLVVRKVNRELMVLQFLISLLLIVGAIAWFTTGSMTSMFSAMKVHLLSGSLLFFAAIMFVEPSTSPGTERKRSYFALLTALLYATPEIQWGIALMPEMALCIVNIFSFVVSPQYRYTLTLKAKRLVASDTYEFEFTTPTPLSFVPGQYMEWTLPHAHSDSRGIRRYFSLASTLSENPTFAMKYYEPPSSYKKNLMAMKIGSQLSTTSLSGDFTLRKTSRPMVFIAGGIGIAPFRSIIKTIIDEKKMVDITLLYINKTEDEVAYAPLWEKAHKYGVETHLLMSEISGHLTATQIQQHIPAWKESLYYVSGPQRLVDATENVLHSLKIPKNQIITDFFPGY